MGTSAQVAVVVALALALYALLQFAFPKAPESVKVGVPFLALPLAAIVLLRKAPDLGRLDRTLLFSAAAYAPFAAVAAAAAPSAAWFYAPLAATLGSLSAALWWAVDTFVHVGAVDFFTKRVVQREAEARWGAWKAVWVQLAVWSAGHVLEWTWLRLILGDVFAAAYLVAAGVVTGLAYLRWKNVGGLMFGHFLVNVSAAISAVWLYG